MKESYETLLKRCIEKGIAATFEMTPVCIPLNARKKWSREKQEFVSSEEYLRIKENVLGEFN